MAAGKTESGNVPRGTLPLSLGDLLIKESS